jgi:hypothetical protein
MSLFAGLDWIRSPLDLNTVTGSSTGAAVAVASVPAITAAALSNGQWNVAKRVQISVAVSSGSSQAPIQFFLFNSISSAAGTILAGWTLSPQNATVGSAFAAPGVSLIDQNDLHIATPTAGQAMCLSGNASAGAGSIVTLNLQTYVLGKQPVQFTTLS